MNDSEPKWPVTAWEGTALIPFIIDSFTVHNNSKMHVLLFPLFYRLGTKAESDDVISPRPQS